MIDVSGEISFNGKFYTVGDIREYLTELDKYGVPDSAGVLDGYAHVIFRGDVDRIECGEHLPSEGRVYDFLVMSHMHNEDMNADDMMEPLGYSESKFEGKS